MIAMANYDDVRFYYLIEWWPEEPVTLQIWQSERWRDDRVIRTVICADFATAIAEVDMRLDETKYLLLQAKADGKYDVL